MILLDTNVVSELMRPRHGFGERIFGLDHAAARMYGELFARGGPRRLSTC
jgi:predicted nucleic acid-binding protein